MEHNMMRLTDDWDGIETIIIFGWGRYGQEIFDILSKDFTIACIIDNDDKKSDAYFEGIPILSLKKAEEKIKEHKIIVTTLEKSYNSISCELSNAGLKEFKDYCKLENFVTEWYWRFRKEVTLFEIHTTITTRCTLKCKNCNMFMPYYENPEDFSYEQIVKDIDLLFGVVDYVYNFELLGGEPFLHKDLNKILSYIKDNYQNRIGRLGIFTNGTLIPSVETWKLLHKYDVKILISDYTDAVPYKKKLEEFIECVEQFNIAYRLNKNLVWSDFGFPQKKLDIKNVKKHMLCCGPVFHGVNDGKLYYCHVAWSAEKSGLFSLCDSDYINLETINKNNIIATESMLAYCLGDMQGEYVSLCRFCGGCGSDNKVSIPAGIQ